MYYELPENSNSLLVDHSEKILGVVNILALRDYMSGSKTFKPFFMFTAERFYCYKQKKDGAATSVYDIDNVKSTGITAKKRNKNKFELLFVLPALLIAYFFVRLSFTSFADGESGVFGVVFFFIDALIFGAFAIYCLIHGLRKSTLHSIIHIYTDDGKDHTVEIPMIDSVTAGKITSSIKKAQSARKSSLPELFLY